MNLIIGFFMIFWRDKGIVINQKPLGEKSFILEVFTHHKGRYSGFVNRRRNPFWKGECVDLAWKARLEEQLGYWTVESDNNNPYLWLIYEKSFALQLLTLLCKEVLHLLPSRIPCPLLYTSFYQIIPKLITPSSLFYYLQFEVILIHELGYGTQQTDIFLHVSPDDMSAESICHHLNQLTYFFKKHYSSCHTFFDLREKILNMIHNIFVPKSQKILC